MSSSSGTQEGGGFFWKFKVSTNILRHCAAPISGIILMRLRFEVCCWQLLKVNTCVHMVIGLLVQISDRLMSASSDYGCS